MPIFAHTKYTNISYFVHFFCICLFFVLVYLSRGMNILSRGTMFVHVFLSRGTDFCPVGWKCVPCMDLVVHVITSKHTLFWNSGISLTDEHEKSNNKLKHPTGQYMFSSLLRGSFIIFNFGGIYLLILYKLINAQI